jgi:hypothetical protein
MKPNHLSSAEDWYALHMRICMHLERVEWLRDQMPYGRRRNTYTDACLKLLGTASRTHQSYLMCMRLNRREQ